MRPRRHHGVVAVTTLLGLLSFGAESALACPICFRVEENATTNGVQAAVLVLMGVTVVVLGAFGHFVRGFVAREGREDDR